VALAQPISNQVDAFQHNVPHLIAEANKRLDSVQKFFNHHGIHIQLKKQGQTALDTIQTKVLEGLELAALVHHQPAQERRHGRVRAGADLRDVGLPAGLRAPDRAAGAPLAPRRRRHGRRRLPDAGAARGRAATCADSCCSAS
jgi:hypothetical protein